MRPLRGNARVVPRFIPDIVCSFTIHTCSAGMSAFVNIGKRTAVQHYAGCVLTLELLHMTAGPATQMYVKKVSNTSRTWTSLAVFVCCRPCTPAATSAQIPYHPVRWQRTAGELKAERTALSHWGHIYRHVASMPCGRAGHTALTIHVRQSIAKMRSDTLHWFAPSVTEPRAPSSSYHHDEVASTLTRTNLRIITRTITTS